MSGEIHYTRETGVYFSSLCVAHHIVLSAQKTLLPLLFSGQAWACDLGRLLLLDPPMFSGFNCLFQESWEVWVFQLKTNPL